MEIISELWTIPESEPGPSKFYLDVGSNQVKKKYKRAVVANATNWVRVSEEMNPLFKDASTPVDELCAKIVASCTQVLNSMKAALPKHDSFALVDIKSDFRESPPSKEERSLSILKSWLLHRRANAKWKLNDDESVIEDINEALALFPSLKEGSIPSTPA